MSGYKLTNAQKTVCRQLADGMIIKKYGAGYWLRNADGQYVGKASIAVKSLGMAGLVAKAEGRIYFTTRGYMVWFGGDPSGDAARLCAQADAHLEYVKSMMADEGGQS